MAGNVWTWNGFNWTIAADGVVTASESRVHSGIRPVDWPDETDAYVHWNGSGHIASDRLRRESPVIVVPAGGWLLNANGSVFAALTEDERSHRLRRAGLSVAAGSREAGFRRYRVPVFHLVPLAVERIMPRRTVLPDSAPTGMHAEGPLYRRVVRTALRALHSLGLEYGEAEVWLDEAGRASIRTVKLPQAGTDGPGSRWTAALQRFAAEYAAARRGKSAASGPDPLRIGADPEFVLLRKDGRIVSAARYLDPRGAAGCDAVPVGRRLAYPVAELRPAPEDSPAALAANLQRLLRQAAGRIGEPGLTWLAGGMPVPGLALGGHIHLSGVWLSARLLRTLDSCVTMPLALVESPGGRARRPRYGWLGDFRRQPHGGFEYRSPPSWLVSPAAARSAFALALLAARETWTLAGRYGDLPAEREAMVSAYYTGDISELRTGLDSYIDRVTATKSYPALAQWIDPLFDAIRQGRTWDEQNDIRQKWGIPID